MSTLQDVIDDGWRELNLIALGTSANTAQTAEGVRLLNQIYNFTIGTTAGEALFNWPLGNFGRESSDLLWATTQQLQNPPQNARLVAVNEEALTVYLPVRPSDGAQIAVIDPHARLATYPLVLDGNGMTIEGAATLTLSTNSINKTWLFRADTGNWVLLNPLVETDTNPYPLEFDQFFAMMLALRLAPRSGVELATTTQAYFNEVRKKFVSRYIQNAPLMADPSLTWTSIQGYDQWYTWRYGSTNAFNQGWGMWNGGPW
ncbi:MAG: hypothetical protein RL254_2092 [Planctomycetota bacterium]